MANITLTDRIAVRVTAKNETEASDQKKRDGGNVADALGATGLTDAEKEAVGASLGETVTGEDGKTYVKSEKIAGALKNLKANGKFQAEPDDYTFGDYGVHIISVPSVINDYGEYGKYDREDRYPTPVLSSSGAMYAVINDNNTDYALFSLSTIHGVFRNYFTGDINGEQDYTQTVTIKGNSYTFGWISTVMSRVPEGKNYTETRYHFAPPPASEAGNFTSNISINFYAEFLFGLREPTAHTGGGGSKIDPTGKTDEQIKSEIEEAAAANNAVAHFSQNPTDTYVAVTDEHGNAMYFLGT